MDVREVKRPVIHTVNGIQVVLGGRTQDGGAVYWLESLRCGWKVAGLIPIGLNVSISIRGRLVEEKGPSCALDNPTPHQKKASSLLLYRLERVTCLSSGTCKNPKVAQFASSYALKIRVLCVNLGGVPGEKVKRVQTVSVQCRSLGLAWSESYSNMTIVPKERNKCLFHKDRCLLTPPKQKPEQSLSFSAVRLHNKSVVC